MAVRKNILKPSQAEDISLIGISCHLKSYRLSFAMNQALRFRFRRINDFTVPAQRGDEMLIYPLLLHNDEDLKNLFCLIGNHHPQGKLIPGLGQVDYFMMAKNPLESTNRSKIIGIIRKISQVNAAYEIDPKSYKDLDILLEEMELHLLNIEMDKKKRRKKFLN